MSCRCPSGDGVSRGNRLGSTVGIEGGEENMLSWGMEGGCGVLKARSLYFCFLPGFMAGQRGRGHQRLAGTTFTYWGRDHYGMTVAVIAPTIEPRIPPKPGLFLTLELHSGVLVVERSCSHPGGINTFHPPTVYWSGHAAYIASREERYKKSSPGRTRRCRRCSRRGRSPRAATPRRTPSPAGPPAQKSTNLDLTRTGGKQRKRRNQHHDVSTKFWWPASILFGTHEHTLKRARGCRSLSL